MEMMLEAITMISQSFCFFLAIFTASVAIASPIIIMSYVLQ